ncbi:M48 family metallopeptidase [Litoreibacter arenae]|uniref:Peptidase M48, Ste24p n=1 Tax=Litoreibacter arenae DSM 19593 TaxID=1123360 RepID=S9RU35_9RHOB|nr:M48 family metallopeptidase [Litoreibacter arenae]EPX77459.1 Peptidase M48, Ste24p [Litoreibacter arenae DSM 19593]
MGDAPKLPGLRGHAYAARSSHRQPARLLTREGGEDLWVDLQNDERAVLASAHLSKLRIDAPLGSAPRKITFPDGAVFETRDHEAIEALTGKTRGSMLHHYEGFNARLFGVVAVCLAAVWVMWRYGLDIMAAVAIAFTPPAVIEQIDAGSMQSIDFTMAEPSKLTDEQKDEVEKVYRRLVRSLPDDVQEKHSFDLLFRDLPGMGPNAFALPGGTMVMTDAFVKQFPDPNVLAGVLGHEIGHVVEEHGLKRLYRSLSTYLLIAFLAGDVGPILEDVVLEGNVLLSLSFSRAQETSADEFGLALSDEAGFDPAGLKLFFEKMGKEYGDQEPAQWMSTHPSSAERVRAIDAFINELR